MSNRPKRLPADKNPRHPSAMRLKDVQPGVEFTWFGFGVQRGRFLSKPFVKQHGTRALVVLAQSSDGRRELYFVKDMGIIPMRSGKFPTGHFTVRRNKEHLVRTPPPLPFPAPVTTFTSTKECGGESKVKPRPCGRTKA